LESIHDLLPTSFFRRKWISSTVGSRPTGMW
jgi:hypothetical protein